MPTTLALAHALKMINVLAGRVLWLYGDPALATGEVYTPWYHAAHQTRSNAIHFHADIQTLAPDYDAVIVNSPKQQEEAEGLLALAMQRSKGFVMAVAAKNAGGNRLAGMMEDYGIAFDTLSNDSCRVVWTSHASAAKGDVIAKNITNLSLSPITMEDETWWTAPGLFGWNKIDAGSRLLLQHLPADMHGHVADFGCGYGYIAVTLSRRYPKITKIDAYDAHAQAVAATRRNGDEKIQALWMDVRRLPTQPQYDAVVMNPPFHSGKSEDVELGESFIRVAWNNLKSGGRLFFVANKHLPYEKIIPGLSSLYEGEGFKIITGTRP
jgi:16S rRNA (guanine1207-N2)-methyltransferase